MESLKSHVIFLLAKSLVDKTIISLTAIILAILFPLILLIFLPLWIVRLSVQLLANCFRPDLTQMLSLGSSSCANISGCSSAPKTINLIELQFDRVLKFETFLQTFSAGTVYRTLEENSEELQYPELRYYLTSWLGYGFWAQDLQFNPRNHIQSLDLQKREVTPEDLRELEEELLGKPFNKGRSPWEMLLIQNTRYGNNPNSTAIFRCSHILADGYSIKKLLEATSDIRDSGKVKIRYSQPGFLQRALMPFKFCYTIAQMNIRYSTRGFPFKTPMAQKSLKDTLQTSDILPAELIQKAKVLHGVSFTSVVFSLVAGALRELALRNGDELVDVVPCVIPLPKPNHPDRLRNHFTLALMELPIGESDPEKRLQLCHAELNRLKSSVYPEVTEFFKFLYGSCFSSLGRLIGVNTFAAVNVSYIPNGLEKCTFMGAEVVGQTFCIGVQRGSIGAVITVCSFKDRIRFHAIVDSGAVGREIVLQFKDILNHQVESLLHSNTALNIVTVNHK